jgi:hypothetical protein
MISITLVLLAIAMVVAAVMLIGPMRLIGG